MPQSSKVLLLPRIGSWSFIFGVIVSIISAFFQQTPNILSVLIVLGLIVGILNITGQQAMTFLLASVSLVVISSLGGAAFTDINLIGTSLQRMLNNLIVFVIPASIIVALRAVLTIAYKR
jgi:hypothetical protein